MLSWLGISAVNPALLWGALAVASPILIHLLSKRRFKRIEWAAMDFLIDADRRNRRRIRLENLLLLLLRCLAIILIALLVSRLFLQPQGLGSLLAQQARTQRIILLDDSPSMRVRADNRDLLENSKQALSLFVRSLAQERPGDSVSLLLASQPARPLRNDFPLEKTDELLRVIDQIEPSDVAGELDKALLSIEDAIAESRAAGTGAINHVIYIVSDLRRRDWTPAPDTPEDRAITKIVQRLGEQTQGVMIVDMGRPMTDNLGIIDIVAREKALVAGVVSGFEVVVKNFGTSEVQDVKVTFTAGEAPPQIGYISQIGAGATGSARFSFNFPESTPIVVSAEIEPDNLPGDNQRLLAGQVQQGINILVVDGDPAADFHAESYFLVRAISPPGDVNSGNVVDVVSESQFTTTNLDDYQVIALCNLYQLPESQRDALRAWVQRGGGLVIFPGDQVDDVLYNDQLYNAGLLPARLSDLRGDESERTWAQPTGEPTAHPVMAIFSGSTNPLLGRVKVFMWWGVEIDTDSPATADPDADVVPSPTPSDSPTTIVARLNDPQNSPLLIEKNLGKGRIMMFTTSADADWTIWPTDASYVITMLELVNYLSPTTSGQGVIRVGQSLSMGLDAARYRPEVQITPPGATQSITVQAQIHSTPKPTDPAAGPAAPEAPASPEAQPTSEAQLAIRYDQTRSAGVYRLALQGHDGSIMQRFFAANIDPDEGDLTPIGRAALASQMPTDRVQIVDGQEYFGRIDTGGRVEMWRTMAVLLLIVLCGEQFLAWTYGRRR